MSKELNEDQKEMIHDNIRAMLAGHKAARWILEDVSATLLNAMDGDPWDVNKMHAALGEYQRAIECVRIAGASAIIEMYKAIG